MQFRSRNLSMRLAFAVMVSICLFQDRLDDISTPRSPWDEMHFSSMLHIYAIGVIKADAFSTDTKVFTLMWLEIKLIYCGPFT